MKERLSVQEQAEIYGIDISLIHANLRLTPTQRLRRHDQTLTTIEKLRKAMKNKHG